MFLCPITHTNPILASNWSILHLKQKWRVLFATNNMANTELEPTTSCLKSVALTTELRVGQKVNTYSSTSFHGSNFPLAWWELLFKWRSYFSRLARISFTKVSEILNFVLYRPLKKKINQEVIRSNNAVIVLGCPGHPSWQSTDFPPLCPRFDPSASACSMAVVVKLDRMGFPESDTYLGCQHQY